MNFFKWVKSKVQIVADPTTLPPLPPVAPSAEFQSHTLPTSASTAPHNLPPTLADIPNAEADYSTASVWAQIFCGNGKVRSQRIPTAAELQRKTLEDANSHFAKTWGQHIELDCRVGSKPPVQPTGPSARELAAREALAARKALKDRWGIDLA
jgi:hypothetical protein